MGTEILCPQDCLSQPIRLSPSTFHHRRNYDKPRTTTHGKPAFLSEKSPEKNKLSTNSSEPLISKRSPSAEDFMTVKVTILKRDQSLDSLNKKKTTPFLKKVNEGNTSVSGDIYAGSAFSMSPSPRALPLPSFFNKTYGPGRVDFSATRDLRRLLRLE